MRSWRTEAKRRARGWLEAPARARAKQRARHTDLRDRVAELEAMVEGLQDALYRHSRQEDERIAELRHRTEPEEMARALSEDARRRGL